jgi:hypothetical protein
MQIICGNCGQLRDLDQPHDPIRCRRIAAALQASYSPGLCNRETLRMARAARAYRQQTLDRLLGEYQSNFSCEESDHANESESK